LFYIRSLTPPQAEGIALAVQFKNEIKREVKFPAYRAGLPGKEIEDS